MQPPEKKKKGKLFLSFFNYEINLLIGEMTLVVSDNDEVRVVLSKAETFITPVATNIKSNFTLRDATRCRRDAYSSNLPSKLSLVRARSFVYLYKHIGLVVRVSEGNFGFIMGMVVL